MSKIEQLIQELCPGGVEYSKICNIADTFIGLATSVTKHKVANGVLLLHNSDIHDGYIKLKTVEYLNPDFVNKNSAKILKTNDIITVHTGDVGTSAIIDEKYDGCIGFTTISSRIKDYTRISPRFLCCFLNSEPCKKAIKILTISDRNNLNLQAFDNLQIPLPPLPIQQEIVRILDTFTEAQANLEQELDLRKKQYEYYRNQLLTFDENDDNVRVVQLSDVAKYSKSRISASELSANNYVSVENLLPNKQGKSISSCCPISGNWIEYFPNDILIGNIRPYLRKIWFSNIHGGTNGDVLAIHIIDENVIFPPFLYQICSSEDFFEYDNKHSSGAKMPRGDKEAIMKYSFALPSFHRQQEIVSILDKFESAIQTLEEELALRKKQYEYYREKLLTFKSN